MLKRLAEDRLSVSIGHHSEAGRRAINQDFCGALIPGDGTLASKGVALAIADGISSSSVSQIAAETAVKSFLTDYYCTSDAWSVKTSGQRVVAATNAWLHGQTRHNGLHEDMNRGFVCTFSAIVLKGRSAHVFHVGDSRIYRMAGASLEQITTDHRIRLSASESHLARALGLENDIEIEYRTLPIRPGDVFIMTTDGVHDHVTSREMATLVAASGDLDAAAGQIAAKASAHGSDDNLTIQIVRVDQLPQSDTVTALTGIDVLPPAPLPRVPCEMDGYRVLRQLHASSRSHIYAAVDANTGEKVAIKVPSVDLRDNIDYLKRFAMEEWIARRIASPHVLKAPSTRYPRETLYVVSELLDGQTLRQWMADHSRPDLESVRCIVEQIAKGLRALHRAEMLHQDMRPENVMIDRDGTVRIIDFGAVRITGVMDSNPALDTGGILGTHQYAAPEYFVGGRPTIASDLYSLGVITYELLTGHLPYGARMARANSRARQSRIAYVPIATYRHDLPTWIDCAIRKAVHFDPSKRQEALSEFTHDLRHPRAGIASNAALPLIERDPVRFWKAISGLLAAVIVALLLWR
jgi:serine/threonine protein phosphatase PrpC